MRNKIIKVKQWVYVNNTFIKPLTEIREMLLENNFTSEDSIVMKMNNVSYNINEVEIKIEKLFKLKLLDTTDIYELEDFFNKNSLGLDITKNLFIKEQSHSKDLIGFFNYLTENVNTSLNTYFKLNSN